MRWWRRLDVRLFASYAAVTAAGAVVLLTTARLLVPPLFDRQIGDGEFRGPMGRGPVMHDALVDALDSALLVALVASLLAGVVVAALVTQWILAPIARVRAAARRLAAGHYDERVDVPSEPELAALAADVNELARSLDETERRRAQLVSDVAHELRTPLTTIRGYAEGMLDGVVTPDRDVLTSVLHEVNRLERLAGDLSTLSRADEGALALDVGPIDLVALVKGVVARFEAQAAEGDVVLAVTAPERLPATGDAHRLEQVVSNLVANAITYTPAGGRISVDVAGDSRSCAVTVADTGIGLAPDALDRVFDRFYRVEGVARPPGGSGIGLAIARALVRAHGGTLTASSPGLDRGATFVLRLPGTEAAGDATGAGAGEAQVHRS